MSKKLIFFSVVFAILLLPLAYALLFPHSFYGTAKVSSTTNAPVNTNISAKVGNVTVGSILVSTAGQYGDSGYLGVSSSADGDTIWFFICGVNTTQSYSYSPGTPTELNLAISSACAAAEAATPSAGGAGGGGAGAGAGAGGAAAVEQTMTVQSIAAGSSGTFSFTKAELMIYQIDLKVKSGVTNAQITVKESSAPVDSPNAIAVGVGGVYKYLLITTNVAEDNIDSVTIHFKVTKSWLNTNSYDENAVVLKRWKNNQWSSLATKMTGSNPDDYTYLAESPGLSVFAITAEKKAAPVEKPVEKPHVVPPVVVPPIVKKVVERVSWTGILIIIAIVVVGLGIYYWKKKR